MKKKGAGYIYYIYTHVMYCILLFVGNKGMCIYRSINTHRQSLEGYIRSQMQRFLLERGTG